MVDDSPSRQPGDGVAAVVRVASSEMGRGHQSLHLMGLGCVLLSGCTTVAQITSLSHEPCHRTVQGQLESILLEEGEQPEVANRLAVNTTVVLATGSLGPRPFGVSSPSGADYSFFVQLKGDQCFLRLYGRRKGFTHYTNNLTYIATRSLAGCVCAE